MAQINCADCLKTYRPYRCGIALLRVLMYGFSDWWEFEEERVIEEQFREHSRDRNSRSLLIDKTRTYSRDESFIEDFNFYYTYLENKLRKNMSATFLCFDCEKYYCTKCVSKHSGHFTFSKDDKYDISKWGTISVEMLDRLKAEGDQNRENMKREQTYLCDVVNVKCEYDGLDLRYVWRTLEGNKWDENVRMLLQKLDFQNNPSCLIALQIFNSNSNWLVADKNNCIKVFNVNDNTMTQRIKLSSSPWGITEIPCTDHSPCLIAVSFPRERKITIMNIPNTPAHVVSSINVQGICRDLAYCNNKLVTRCYDDLDGEWRTSIHVMGISGEIINIIDLNNLPDVKLNTFFPGHMSVHSESETIYVCHRFYPFCVVSLSLDGQVLHSVTFTDLKSAFIQVDKDQNVYVMSYRLPIYKLSADLRHRKKVIDKDVVDTYRINAIGFHHDKFYLASAKEHVYIIQHE